MVILILIKSSLSPLPNLRQILRRTKIERARARRSALPAREKTKVTPVRRDRAELELVQDPVLAFAFDELPVAVAATTIRRRAVLRSCVGVRLMRLGLEHGFFGGVPTPKAVLVQVHPMSRGCEARDAHELFVAR